MIQNLIRQVCPNAVDCINSNPLGSTIFGFIYLFDEGTQELVIIWSELFLDMEHDRYDAFKELLVGLEHFCLKDWC